MFRRLVLLSLVLFAPQAFAADAADGVLLWSNEPLIYHNSIYSKRRPIGTEASLRNYATADLERFYRDWYRPDLMAVIAVGDFDSEIVESLIRKAFSDLENPPDLRPRRRPE